MIVGIDEVGRGPWAGPLVVGAVVLGDAEIAGLTDSKKLTKKRREVLAPEIYEKAAAVGLGWVSAGELDECGMSGALTLACKRALGEIRVPYHGIVLDGTVNFLKDTGKGPYVTTLKQADLLVPSVSAASIVAKVARDEFMVEMAEVYTGYGFESHVGYGTKAHQEALVARGVTPIHRKSFAPVRALLKQDEQPRSMRETLGLLRVTSPTTREIGNASEDVAAEYLTQQGYTVVERNWKKRQCEIDVVAMKGDTFYFCEVKHRKSTRQGTGLDAITPRKYQQMKFAARVYAHWHGVDDRNLRLLAIATTNTPPVVIDCVELT